MAENYTVNYQINVNEQPALQAIQRFQQATLQLEQLTKRFDLVAKSVGKVNSALASIRTKPVNIQVNTGTAEANLKRVSALLSQIQTRAKTSVSVPNLGTLNKTLKEISATTNTVNRNTIKPKANTQNAINSLDALLRKINQIKANRNITITASAAGASTAARGTTVVSGKTPIVRTTQNTGAGHSTFLYPSTRQVLGPTYANTGTNVAGEMIKGMGIAYGLSSLMSGVTSVFRDASAYDNITQTTRNILATHDKGVGFDGRFNEMNQLMRQVGVETRYTAPQVAEAGKFLAMAGFNVDQIKQSIRPISDIALVGDTDLGETADVVTNIMTAYEIPARKMGNASDVLTMTFTKTNTTLMELAESFKYAGTVAHQAGLSFETSSAAFGILGDAGIKGSHAGTTLRMIVNNMMNPTKKQRAAWNAMGVSTKDDEGNLRNIIDIFKDLNKKSETMSSGDFITLMGQMFRITAIPGALALVNNVGKLQEVTEKNYASTGLASELAGQKKNTIQGLWYQMTSAFTETGMQGFEQMQSVIRDFLQRMIQLMKSQEFATALKDMMDMFVKILDAVIGALKTIMKIWNWLPNWAKDGLVGFIKIQMHLGIVSSILQSIMSTFLMIRGILFGSWLVGIGKFVGTLGQALRYIVQMYAFSRLAGIGRMASVGQAIGRGVFGNAGLIAAGAGVSTSAAGGAAVSGGATLISLLGKGIAGLLTTPVGWGVMALGAVAAIGYQIYDTYLMTEAAIKANEAWGQSYRNLGVEKLNLSDPDALMIGNMRIFNNELLTQNERVAQSAELWHRYWMEKNGPKETKDDSTKFIDTEGGKNFKTMLETADMWFNVHKSFAPLLKSLGGNIMPFDYLDGQGRGHRTNHLNLFGRSIDLGPKQSTINENAAVQILLAQLGADPNNERRLALEKYLINQASSAHSYQDYLNIVAGARKSFMPTQYLTKWDWISSETAEKMTWSDITSSQMYVLALRDNMEKVFKTWEDFALVIKDYDEGKSVDYLKVQKVLEDRFGMLFDTSKGLFGTEGWLAYVKDIVDNPTKYKFDSVKEATAYVTNTFDQLVGWYNLLDSHYKPLFASFLNRSPFENVIPNGYTLGEGGVTGGTTPGETRIINGVKYTWSPNDLISKNPIYSWHDAKGNIYTPTDGKTTTKWSPNTNDSSGGKSLANSLHNGADQSQYKSHYNTNSAAPKQVIVRIENLMRVDKQMIDMTDERQVAAVENIKQELATALLDVVQDFNANIIS